MESRAPLDMFGGICSGKEQPGTPLHIVQVIPSVDPTRGGSVISCLQMSREMARQGHRVSICTVEGAGADATDGGLAEGVEIYGARENGAPYGLSAGLLRLLGQRIQGADIVHIHGLYRFHLPAAAALSRCHRVPYVVKPHGSLDPFLYRVRRWRKSIPEWLIIRPALAAASGVHFTALEELHLARATGAFGRWSDAISGKAIIVREGVDVESSGGCGVRDFFELHPELAGKRIILFLGRINFKKGLDILARAFGRIGRARPDTHLVLAGPDSEGYGTKVRRWLAEEGVLDRATFTGMLQGRVKRGAYEAASAFVLPSYTENFGLTIVEALGYGVPVVLSTKVNIWRELVAADAGLATDCDGEQVAAAVLSVLDNPPAAQEMAARGRLFANNYRWESVVPDMIAEYRKVIASFTASQ